MTENHQYFVIDKFVQRLNRVNNVFEGYLYGVCDGARIVIMSFTIIEDKKKECEKHDKYIVKEDNFPAPMQNIGLICCTESLPELIQKCDFIDRMIQNPILKELSSRNRLIVVGYDLLDDALSCYLYKNCTLSKVPYEHISEVTFLDDYMFLKLNGGFHINEEFTGDQIGKIIEEKINQLSHSKEVKFSFENTERYVMSDTDLQKKPLKDIQLSAVLLEAVDGDKGNIKYLRLYGMEYSVLSVQMNFPDTCQCTDLNLKGSNVCDEAITNSNGIKAVPIDSLLLCRKDELLENTCNVLADSAKRALRLVANSFKQYPETPQAFHFHIPELGHFVTVTYPSNHLDKDLVPIRECLHFTFAMGRDQPLFTKGKALMIQKIEENGVLSNVHEKFKPSGISEGEFAMVSGRYDYYHYRQLDVADDGWGCAYRSLQTIYSWYKYQGWTDKPVPSHREIQQILVDIGDKPKSFVGSRQWIGSIEVSFVLDTLLGVVCRILQVQKGDSLDTYAYNIMDHFKHNGSPIMIGGGVLAHTIIGVHIDDETDEIKYLILDPHYTGPDKLQSIQSKGGIAWKKPDFWKKSEFYNMCLPLKKTGV